MAEALQDEHNLNVEIDPDFEPQKRPRSCTWPLPRPESGASKPGTNDTDVIPEEEDDENDAENGAASEKNRAELGPRPPHGASSLPVEVRRSTPSSSREEGVEDGSPSSSSIHPSAAAAHGGSASQQLRKSSARRNAWGNYSYADLITQAIESSPENRLTLSQIYDWMVRSVPYFKDKGDSNSSAGWKNSIRHNLSLHSRFVKVQNEGTGKSSWWMVNPEGGKGGKAPRRRAVSMDNSKYIKGARGRATKKKASLMAAAQDGSSESSSSLSKWTGSPASRSSDELDAWTDFRSRTNSNASTLSGRLSPILANPELDEAQDGGGSGGGGDSAPLSPMLYSSPSSMSSSTGPMALPDLAGSAMNLNDGLSDNLMDDLLDNISLTAAQQAPPGEGDDEDEDEDDEDVDVEEGEEGEGGGGGRGDGTQAGSVFPFGCPGAGLGSPSASFGAPSLFSPPCIAGLRQSPMQTIQENRQTTFSCGPLFGDAALQDLLGLEAHGPANVMLTQSDPLMSQAMSGALQNTRRNALLLRKDPPLSLVAGLAPGGGGVSVVGWQAGLPTHANGRPGSSAAGPDAKARLQRSPVRSGSPPLGAGRVPPAPPHRFPADLDLDVFNGDLECDMDAIIRNELMDADCLDLSFEPHLASAQNTERNGGGFSGSTKTSPQSWVPG
ncbi:unnamed protein product [Arctogadus glacialis]